MKRFAFLFAFLSAGAPEKRAAIGKKGEEEDKKSIKYAITGIIFLCIDIFFVGSRLHVFRGPFNVLFSFTSSHRYPPQTPSENR